MILTKKQEEGLKIALSRFYDGEKYTVISGYAGTGKSTLVRFIIEAIGMDEDEICFATYTGKAAQVLEKKGNKNVGTLHKLLYKAVPLPNGSFKFIPKADIGYSLVIVDEVSMAPKTLMNLLFSHRGVHIICLGDPFQLPTIDANEDNGLLQNPHIFLDEIMRQAQESEIIRLTMDIRAGKELQLFKGNEVQVIDQRNIIGGMYGWADQIIVAKNATRRNINSRMRKMLFDVDTDIPVEGDKIICLRNAWETVTEFGETLVNGTIGTISNIKYNHYHPFLHPQMTINFLSDDYTAEEADKSVLDMYFRNLNIDYKLLTTGEETVNAKNFKRFPKEFRPLTFDYGYCITCHKSQGSEYSKVLVFEEFLKGNDHARWLYTAATRAKEKLVIVRNFR